MNDLAPDLPLPDSAPTPDSISQPRAFDLSQPEPRERRPFSDLTLFIPGMTTPVQGFDGGINLAALDNHREKGLLCLLDPYQEMNELDFIELFCRDTLVPVGTHTVSWTEAEKGLQIPFYIPRTRLPDGSVEPVFFKVTRVTGGNPEETRRFKLKVDTVRPGGRNPVASTFQNENLAKPIFPRDLIDFGVGEGDIGTPVPVTIDFYPVENLPANTHRTPRDRIRLSIGGVIIEHRVTDGEGAPNNRDPIDVMVNTGDWKKVGSGSHVCEYEVIDEVGNYSDGWSPAQILEVRLDDGAEPLLPEAYVEESNEDDILDADKLDGKEATIVIAVTREDYVQGDILRVKVAGRTTDNITVIRSYEQPVTIIGRAAKVPWPFIDIQPLINGRAEISYERIRAGMPNRRSRSVLVGVIGTPVSPGLPAPVVHDAPGSILPPDVQYLTVDVLPYLGQDHDDRVVLILEGTRANGSSYYRELTDRAGSDDQKVTFRLLNGPGGEIAELEGGTLRLYYQVTNTEGTRTSDDIDLDVGDPVASLPEPFLEEAPPPDYVFDPALSPFDLKVLVRKHPDIQANDTVTVHFEGTAPGGSFTPAPIKVIGGWIGVDLPYTIPRQYVIANLDRSASVYYTVERENSRRRLSHAVPLRVGSALDLPVAYIYQSTVTGPDTATINPMQVVNPPVVSIRVKYDGMQASDDIKLYWIGRPGLGTPEIPAKPGAASADEVDFTLSDNRAVAANLGHSLTVYYEVTRGGKTTKSAELTVKVMNFEEIPGGNPLKGLVSVPEATNGVIDTARAHRVHIKAWPFKRAGQALWIYLRGTIDLTLRNGTPVSGDELNREIEHSIPSDYLGSLADRSSLSVQVLVSLDGSNSLDTATPFEKPSYTVSRAAGIIAHIDVGGSPMNVVLRPDGLRAYVSNYSSDSVSVIDTTTNRVIQTITGLNKPWGLAIHPSGSPLYVSNFGTVGSPSSVTVIDTSTHSTLSNINGPISPQGLALNLDGSTLYVAASGFIYAYRSTSPYTRLASIAINHVVGLALSNTGARLYAISNNTPGAMYLIDTQTHTSVAWYRVMASNAYSIACDPHHPRVYVSNRTGSTISIVNTNDYSDVKPLQLDSHPYTAAFHPTQKKAYVALWSPSNSLCVIDTQSEQVLSNISGLNNPMGVAINADGSRAYVTNNNSHSVSVVAL